MSTTDDKDPEWMNDTIKSKIKTKNFKFQRSRNSHGYNDLWQIIKTIDSFI